MDTILNVGINDANVNGLAVKHRNVTFALDSYRRLLQMFGSVVLTNPEARFRSSVGSGLAGWQGSQSQTDNSFIPTADRVPYGQTIPHGSTRSITASGGSRIRILEQ